VDKAPVTLWETGAPKDKPLAAFTSLRRRFGARRAPMGAMSEKSCSPVDTVEKPGRACRYSRYVPVNNW
jgi:hypothetical protein